jgi:hypothetical protein
MIACGAWSANVCCASERECGHGMDVAQKVAPLIFGFPPFWGDEVTFLVLSVRRNIRMIIKNSTSDVILQPVIWANCCVVWRKPRLTRCAW